MSFPQHNHGGEPSFWHEDVTSCGDVSSRAVYSCDWKVRNECLEHYILSNVHNLLTKQMLNIDYLKLNYLAKVSWLTGSASNRNANTRMYDSTCTKIWENGSIITEMVQTCERSCLLQSCWFECFSCIFGVHVLNVKKPLQR